MSKEGTRILENRKYTEEAYKNKLLQLEKDLIHKALIRTKGRIDEAYKLVCPNNKPILTVATFKGRMLKHNLYIVAYRQGIHLK